MEHTPPRSKEGSAPNSSDRSTNISGAGSTQSISWEQRIQHSEEPIGWPKEGDAKLSAITSAGRCGTIAVNRASAQEHDMRRKWPPNGL